MAFGRREKRRGQRIQSSEPNAPLLGVGNMGGINEFSLQTWQEPDTDTWRMLPLGRGFGFSDLIPNLSSELRVRAGTSGD